MTKRPTFERACAQYLHRFTMDHVPNWATKPLDGKYYAPQFTSDREWYEHTLFKGDPGYNAIGGDCYTTGQTWPLGQWLDSPFRIASDVALEGIGKPAKIPLGFTSTEIEVSESVESVVRLWALLADYGGAAEDFLDQTYMFELVCETLTDGSEKRSIRIRPAEPV